MNKLRTTAVCFLLIASIFTTGCDASKVMEVIQKVAEGIQQAMPAIRDVVNTITQAVNGNTTQAGNNVTNTQTATNTPAETNNNNKGSTTTVATAKDNEDLASNNSAASPSVTTEIPNASSQESGSSFMQRTANMSRAQKDQAIIQAITSGNMPSFLRNFRDVTVRRRLSDGREHTITYKVMPDYLSIGSDSDFVRVPMTPMAAQAIADRFGCILPTTQMVDDIYQNAATRLSPQTMTPNSSMTSNSYFTQHSEMIETARRNAGHQNGQLLAGHKKDIVITNRLNSNPNKVAIYGWHRSNGSPIQPLSTVHGEEYADYSHGVRLIQKTVMVDGREMNIEDVLRDPVLSALVSKEGTISNTSAHR
jgi:hypothetical protein